MSTTLTSPSINADNPSEKATSNFFDLYKKFIQTNYLQTPTNDPNIFKEKKPEEKSSANNAIKWKINGKQKMFIFILIIVVTAGILALLLWWRLNPARYTNENTIPPGDKNGGCGSSFTGAYPPS